MYLFGVTRRFQPSTNLWAGYAEQPCLSVAFSDDDGKEGVLIIQDDGYVQVCRYCVAKRLSGQC